MSESEKILVTLAGVHDFYGKDLSPFAIQVWLKACEGFSAEQVSKAMSAHLMDAEQGRFPPKPADIVRQLQGTRSDRSLIAWGKVLDAMQRVGAYQSVVFDDPIVHAAIEDVGGWVAVCRGEMDALPFLEKRFCDSYKANAARGVPAYTAVLPGAFAIENATKGYKVAEPVLIGNAKKAQDVFAQGGDKPKTEFTPLSVALNQAAKLFQK